MRLHASCTFHHDQDVNEENEASRAARLHAIECPGSSPSTSAKAGLSDRRRTKAIRREMNRRRPPSLLIVPQDRQGGFQATPRLERLDKTGPPHRGVCNALKGLMFPKSTPLAMATCETPSKSGT